MSNEFILVVSWKPTNRNDGDRLTKPQVAKLISSVTATSATSLVDLPPDNLAIFCMEPMPGNHGRYFIGLHEIKAECQENGKCIENKEETKFSYRCVKYYAGYMLVLSNRFPVLLRGDGSEAWSLDSHKVMSTDAPHTKTHCQNVELVHGIVYYVQTDGSVVELNLSKIVEDIKTKGHSSIVPRVFNEDIYELCWNHETRKLYSLSNKAKVFSNESELFNVEIIDKAIEAFGVNKNIATYGKYIVVVHSGNNYFNMTKLYDTRGRQLDTCDDAMKLKKTSPDELNVTKHAKMFQCSNAIFLIYSRKTDALELFLIENKKLHYLPVSLQSHESNSRNSVYGFIVKAQSRRRQSNNTIELIVYGYATVVTITVNFKF